MKRLLSIAGGVLLALFLGVVAFFFWASGGHVDTEAEQQIKTYRADTTGEADTLTVLTYNIGYLSGMTNNRPVDPPASLFRENMEAAETLIRAVDADVIGFQEIDFGASRSYGIHQLDTLAARLGYPMAAQATNWDKRYVPFPYWPPAVHFGRMHSGQAVASRFPIVTHHRLALVRPPRPFFSDAFYLDRLAQVAVLEVDARPLVVINVHLEAFDGETRQQQARQVRALTDAYLEANVPMLVIGDFNSVFAETLGALPDEERSRFQGDATMATLRADGLAPGFPVPPPSTGDVPGTYPADAPSRKIDHILYTTDWMTPVARSVRCGPSGNPPADHCAVSLTVAVSPSDEAPSGPTLFNQLPSQAEVQDVIDRARP